MVTFRKSVKKSADIVNDVNTLIESRFNPAYFTRRRKMPFDSLLKYLLSLKKTSTQAALNSFLEEDGITMSQQALSKARNKFDHTPFQKLFTGIRDLAYDDENRKGMQKYKDKYYLIAVDGSQIALPNIPRLLKTFGGNGSKASSPSGRASIAYDVLNDFIMDADMVPLSTDERTLAKRHIENVGEVIDLMEALFLFDRGYPSDDLIHLLSGCSHYLMRVRSKFNLDIDALPLGSHVITLFGDVKVRIVKFTLPSGEVETLISNLFDLDESEFQSLYFLRWPVELKYDIVKNKLELPNFGGFTENIILQDFWISMYLANMAAIAKHEADLEIKAERAQKENKYEYQANVNTVIGSLRDRLARAVFAKDPVTRIIILNRIMEEIKRSVVPKRPNVTVPRDKTPRKAKFHHNKKSNV